MSTSAMQYQETSEVLSFQNVVFAGGGSRCMWQLGFWDGANNAGLRLNKTVKYAASTSAGCAMATAAMLDRGPEALALFKGLTEVNPTNVHWHNLKPGADGPLLPHIEMYRTALEKFLKPEDFELLKGRRLEFLMARFPQWLPSSLGTLLAFTVYGLEKHVTGALHLNWTRKLGFQPITGGTKDAENVTDLIDTILAASCVPPVLPGNGYRGQRVLDGGIIDNVPAYLADGLAGRTLVLLSKRYWRELPAPAQRVYVQPSKPIAIDKFDYANPKGLQDAYDLGLEDGNEFSRVQTQLQA